VTTLLIGSFFALILLNVPIAFAMAISTLAVQFASGVISPQVLLQRMVGGVDFFPLQAIPFFMLAGSLMNAGGITPRLVTVSQALVGHLRGGLAQVTIVTNMFMAGISGSGSADAAATGAVLIPAMIRAGYSPRFAAVVTGAAATMGPIIPPSIIFVVYGSLANVSIGRLFVAGIVPGVIVGLSLMGLVYWLAKRRGFRRESRATVGQFLRSLWMAGPAVLMPVLIVLGIVLGFATATELAAFASVYAWVVGMFVFKELKWRDLPKILRETVLATATVMFIIAAASPFAWIVAWEQIPKLITDYLMAWTQSPWALLLIVNVVLLILGCLMEGIAITIILVPILVPLLIQAGIDLVHFGVLFTVNIMIGTLTPPVGVQIYITSAIARISVTEFCRDLGPFLAILILVLLLVTYIPALTLTLPGLLMGRAR
jgi:tripartite ATP-independent transporter DctM subunit